MKKTKTNKPTPTGNQDKDAEVAVEATDPAEQASGVCSEQIGDEPEVVDSIEGLNAKIEALSESLHRAKADYQNLQRRVAIDRTEAIRYANGELMKSLLGVLDDFERSLEAAKSTDNHDAVIDGIRLVYENFVKALGAHGLERIEALGRVFDPSFHEALLQQPSLKVQVGAVLEEINKGYRLHDRVLRPTKVIVSKGAVDQGEGESDDSPVESQGKS